MADDDAVSDTSSPGDTQADASPPGADPLDEGTDRGPLESGATPADEEERDDREQPERIILIMLQLGVGPAASLSRQVAQKVIQDLGGLQATRSPKSRVDVWLDSPGGDAHAAYKLGLFLRSRFEEVNFIIVDYAKSAATLLALAADTIFMAPAAELGPLDTQENREGEVRMRSNLDTANTIENVYFQVVNNALSAGVELLRQTGLTREQTIQHVLDFSAQFSRPLLEQIDVVAVNSAQTSLDVAIEYGARLLSYRHDRDGLPEAKARMAQLVRAYPTHGYVIDRDEARDGLELPVRNIEEYDLLPQLELLYDEAQTKSMSLVAIMDARELLNPEGGADADAPDPESEADDQ